MKGTAALKYQTLGKMIICNLITDKAAYKKLPDNNCFFDTNSLKPLHIFLTKIQLLSAWDGRQILQVLQIIGYKRNYLSECLSLIK